MLAFVLTRLANAFLVMLAVALVAFSLFNFVGDPVTNMLGENAPPDRKAELRQALGLDAPMPIQFLRFLQHAVRGDFGMSFRNLQPVSSVLIARLPATLELSLMAVLIALGLGIPAGVYTGLRRNAWSSQAIQAASLVGVSIPSFLTGILLILVFSVTLPWLPSYGRGDVIRFGWWTSGLFTTTGLKSLVLPSITLALFQTTLIMRLVRSEMLEVLRTDYIKFARARGLNARTIHFGHALKNTLIPVITITGLQLGSIIAFAIITETVFQWPGMGSLVIQAITFGDMPVLSAYLVLVSALFVAINLIVDLLYYVVDPRLRVGHSVGGA
ncbi:MAG: binding-protein-dependent permease [candidate division NC10 bacterium]|nr:binding-protein-dependent permease [candidate division NC10 bacterium]